MDGDEQEQQAVFLGQGDGDEAAAPRRVGEVPTEERLRIEDALMRNEIKAVVAHCKAQGEAEFIPEESEAARSTRQSDALRAIKRELDPGRLFNPGKIIDTPKMDDATLFRFASGYKTIPLKPVFDWSAWDVQNDPATGKPYGSEFPVITVADMVRTERAFLDEIGVTHARVGAGRIKQNFWL